MNNYVLYFHINPSNNEVFYVGIGNYIRAKRTDTKSRNRYWNNYVKKYNVIPVVQIIHENLSFKNAAELEKTYIARFGRKGIDENGILVNRSIGGEKMALGFKHSEDAKTKISNALRKRKMSDVQRKNISERMKKFRHTEEAKLKNSLAHKGEKHPHYGKPKSEITKSKIAAANIGRCGILNGRSKKVINVITKEIYGSTAEVSRLFFPESHINTLSYKLKGRITNNTDFLYLEDYNNGKSKYINSFNLNKPKKVINLETGEVYNSVAEAARLNNVTGGTIFWHVNNKLTKSKPKYAFY